MLRRVYLSLVSYGVFFSALFWGVLYHAIAQRKRILRGFCSGFGFVWFMVKVQRVARRSPASAGPRQDPSLNWGALSQRSRTKSTLIFYFFFPLPPAVPGLRRGQGADRPVTKHTEVTKRMHGWGVMTNSECRMTKEWRNRRSESV